MLKNISAILLACLLSAGSVQAADDLKNLAGYGKTTWGMTPDEVLNAETPRAEKLEKQDKFIAGLSMVTIKEIQIGDTKVRAIFIFDELSHKLRQVILTGAEKKNPKVNALSFSSVEKLLTEKYGPPTYKEEARVASWKLPKTSIDLTHLNTIPGIISQVTINYYKRTTTRGNAEHDP
jgi:hypothetical protein